MVDCHTEVPTPFAPLSDATPEEEALVEGTADETMGGHGTQISELSPDDFGMFCITGGRPSGTHKGITAELK